MRPTRKALPGIKGDFFFRGRRPLAAPALLLGSGIVLTAWLPPYNWWWSAAAAGAALLVWIGAAAGAKARASAAALFFLFLGAFRLQAETASGGYDGIDPASGDVVAFGVVAGPVEKRDGALVFELTEIRVRAEGRTYGLDGRLQARLWDHRENYAAGDRLILRGKLRPPGGDRNLAWFPPGGRFSSRTVAARLDVSSSYLIRRLGRKEDGGPAAAVTRLREKAVLFWDRRPGPAAALLKALTTGQRGSIPTQVRESFYHSGLAHLLAVSGLHLGFIAFFLYLIFRAALSLIEPLINRYPVQPAAAAATLPFIVLFYLFSGQQVSAGRAALMAGTGLAATVLFRRTDPLNLVAGAALLMLFAKPLLLFSVSFQLSFAAVTALVLAAPGFPRPPPAGMPHRRWMRLPWYFAVLFLTSLTATIGTIPLVAYHFHRLSPAGPAANLAAVPLTGFAVIPLGWGAVLANWAWPPAGEALAGAALAAGRALIRLAELFSSHPWSSLPVPRPPPLLVLTALFMTAALLAVPSGRKRRAVTLLPVALTLLSATWWIGSRESGNLKAVFLDVGQGEAVLVRLPGGESLLVDTGPAWQRGDAGRFIVAPSLRKLGVARLDYLILSHLHPDHSGGLVSLLEEFPVGEIWSSPFGWEGLPPALAGKIDAWKMQGGRLSFFRRGGKWSGSDGVEIIFLNPPGSYYRSGDYHQDMNDNSLAFLLRWGDFRLVMTGDIGEAPSGDIASMVRGEEGTTILKVPHHGARQGKTEALAAAFRPRYAVVSVGRNNYGHPHREVVAAFERGGEVLRTDVEGAVFFRSDGRDHRMWTWRRLTAGRTWRERIRWLLEGY